MILIFSIYATYKISLVGGTLNTLAVLAGVRTGFRERRKPSQKRRNKERFESLQASRKAEHHCSKGIRGLPRIDIGVRAFGACCG